MIVLLEIYTVLMILLLEDFSIFKSYKKNILRTISPWHIDKFLYLHLLFCDAYYLTNVLQIIIVIVSYIIYSMHACMHGGTATLYMCI